MAQPDSARIARERDELNNQLYSADPTDQADAYTALQTMEADDIVAYRSKIGRMLRCLAHAPANYWPQFVEPVTSEDLPDGGICTYPSCGIDVLIKPASRIAEQ